MTSTTIRPSTFAALLAAIPGNPDFVSPATVRLSKMPTTPRADSIISHPIVTQPDADDFGRIIADLLGPAKPFSERSEAERRHLLLGMPAVSRPEPGWRDALRRIAQRLHAGRAYVTDSPMRGNPLGLLRLVSPLAHRMTEGVNVHEGIQTVLRSLALDSILDFGNPGFQGICTLAGQPATFDGLCMLDGEDLFSALLYGLSLDAGYKREIAPPDPWLSWHVLNERRPLAEFAIEYFPEVNDED